MGAHRSRRRAEEGCGGARLNRSRVVSVQPDVPAIHRAFRYLLPGPLTGAAVGTVVRVPLHGRRVRGWILEHDPGGLSDLPVENLQEVIQVVSDGPPPDVVDLCRWAAWRWAGPLATLLRAASAPNRVRAAGPVEREVAVYPGDPLRGRELLIIGPREVPEVALAPEGSTMVIDPSPARAARLVATLRDEGREVVTPGAPHVDAVRTREWNRAREGACVVIGGRSAVWAPVPDLAAVVVLDEGDEALEDERAPTWNARDVALERARRAGVAVRVITPAPTVDALVAVGKPEGVSGRWPPVQVVDQRDEEPGHGLLSAALADALRHTASQQRAVCVLNRRGRARLLACRTCRELARCEACGSTVEQRDVEFVCASCATARPVVCLHCHGSTFRAVRPGIARVRDDLAALLPRTEVAAVDAATPSSPDAPIPDVPVLIGTEAVLHRVRAPVGLVAYLELDQELLAPRARAVEQALWLLARGARLLGERGRLLLQTRLPDHEVVRAVRRGDPMVVADADRRRRAALGFPPFGGLAELSGVADAVGAACAAVSAGAGGVTVLGPTGDGTRALLRAPSTADLCDALAQPGIDAARARGRLRIDVDPRRV